MASKAEKPGVVLEKRAATFLDTREMEWEDFPGKAGAKMKVLSRFENGEPSVFLVWTPPGLGSGDAHRHYHRTVHEFHFFLEGDFPIWEYDSPDQAEGQHIVIKPGFYLERRPGEDGIHGMEGGPTSETGCLMLQWRTGTGNWTEEADYHEESVDVPYP